MTAAPAGQHTLSSPHPTLKVALFTDSIGPGYNGLTIAVRQLRDGLLSTGHDVIFVAPRGQEKFGKTSSPSFLLPALRLPGVHPAIANGLGFRRCFRQLVHANIDVVHVNSVGPIGLLGVFFAVRRKLPLVVTWHTDILSYLGHYPLLKLTVPLWLWAVERFCVPNRCRRVSTVVAPVDVAKSRPALNLLRGIGHVLQSADLITAPSKKVAGQLKRLSIDTPICIVPAGVDGVTSRPALRSASSDRALSSPRLLYVGRIASEKGIELLLDAFALVREAIPGATLQLVGDATRSRTLRRRLRGLRHDSAVTLAGEVEPSLLHTYYDNADVFVFPSTTDTQALVLHEAAHSGLPIVTVDEQLQAVVVEGRNALVSEASAVALSRTILAMLVSCSEPEYFRDAGKTGRRLAGGYSRERQLIEMIRLYRLVLTDMHSGNFE